MAYTSNSSTDEAFDREDKNQTNYLGDFSKNNVQFSTYLKTKINAKQHIKTGIRIQGLGINFNEGININDVFTRTSNLEGNYFTAQGYLSYQQKINKKITTVIGANSQYFNANKKISFEPRASIAYKVNLKNILNFGYGFHTKLPDLQHISMFDETTQTLPNEKLDFIKSHHFVMGYAMVFGEKWKFKAELYYQKITNATIAANTTMNSNLEFAKIYSSLNANSAVSRSNTNRVPLFLADGGKGENYGIEFTLERSLDKGFYFLSTISLFESNYIGKDAIRKSTVFNGNIVSNLLVGKEWSLSKKIRFNINTKFVYAEGLRFIPIDLEASITSGDEVFDYTKAYQSKLPYYARADFSAGIKLDWTSVSQEWKLEIKNLTNRKNIFDRGFNAGEIVTQYQTGFFPVFLYRIYF